MASLSWTNDQQETLAALLSDGRTFSEIGAALGKSRNAIAAKIDRTPALKNMPERRRDNMAAGKGGWRSPRQKDPPAPPPAPPPTAPPPRMPKSRELRLADLLNSECKWPGDHDSSIPGGYPFCGHATGDPLASYCPYHARLAGSGYSASHRLDRLVKI